MLEITILYLLTTIFTELVINHTDPLGFGVYLYCRVCLCGPKNIKAFLNKMKANLKKNLHGILEAPNSLKSLMK